MVLRHEPEIIGIEIDPFGWVEVKKLIDAMNSKGKPIDIRLLEEIVLSDTENLYSFNTDKTKIRANGGHTVSADVKAAPAVPPDILYHGTGVRFIESIKRHGLLKQCRNHVHLSGKYPLAADYGARHGKNTVLKINAKAMHEAGCRFFISENNTWLTEAVPVKYIIF